MIIIQPKTPFLCIPGAPRPAIGAQVRGGNQGFRLGRRLGRPWGTPPAVRRAAPQDLNLLPAPWRSHPLHVKMQFTATFRGGVIGALGLGFAQGEVPRVCPEVGNTMGGI